MKRKINIKRLFIVIITQLLMGVGLFERVKGENWNIIVTEWQEKRIDLHVAFLS